MLRRLLFVAWPAVNGQCTMCMNAESSDWTAWGGCSLKTGERCLDLNGDWTSWETCCSKSSGVPTPAPAPNTGVPVRVRTVNGNCNCDWITGPWGCGTYDGTDCWRHCCQTPLCDCSWARGPGACTSPDYSQCWDFCCIHSTSECHCGWVRSGGCKKDDGTHCYKQCCGTYLSTMTFASEALLRLGIPGLNPGVAGCVLLLFFAFLGALALCAVRRGIGGARGVGHDLLLQSHRPIAPCDGLLAPVQATSCGDASEAEALHNEGGEFDPKRKEKL